MIKELFKKKLLPALYTSLITAFIACTFLSLFSCASLPRHRESIKISRRIMDQGQLTAEQLAAYFISRNSEADRAHIIQFAQYYIDEAAAEGINSDVAFAQMCLETGYLKFGNLVTKEMHNYCGLGSIDKDNPGVSFATMQEGVRAHIQHLQAYATKEDQKLNNPVIDPRYDWPHKSKYITDISGLAGNWATDPKYSEKLENLIQKIEEFYNR